MAETSQEHATPAPELAGILNSLQVLSPVQLRAVAARVHGLLTVREQPMPVVTNYRAVPPLSSAIDLGASFDEDQFAPNTQNNPRGMFAGEDESAPPPKKKPVWD